MKRRFAHASMSILVPMVIFVFTASAQYATPFGKIVRNAISDTTASTADAVFSYASKTMGPPGEKKINPLRSASRALESVGVMTAHRIVGNAEDVAFAGDSVSSFYAFLNQVLPGRRAPEQMADVVFVASDKISVAPRVMQAAVTYADRELYESAGQLADAAMGGANTVQTAYASLNRNLPGRDVPSQLAATTRNSVRSLAMTADALAGSSAAINGTSASILDSIGSAITSAADAVQSFFLNFLSRPPAVSTVSPSVSASPAPSAPAGGGTTTVTNISTTTSVTQAQLISALRTLLSQGLPADLLAKLTGPQGPAGTAGVQGPAGYSIGAVYSNPSNPNQAGTIGGVTYFGAKEITTESLTATGTSTLTTLNVSGATTLSSLNVTGPTTLANFTITGLSSTNASISGTLEAGTIKGDVELAHIGNSTLKTVQDMQNVYHSTGWVSGGEITPGSGGDITVSEGTGLIRNALTVPGTLATLLFFDWPAVGPITLTDNAENFVYVDYNGGNPTVTVQTTEDTSDYQTRFLLAIVSRVGTNLYVNDTVRPTVGDHAALMIREMQQTMPYTNATGGEITAGTNPLSFNISDGSWWQGLNRFTTPAFDGNTDTFTYYYRNGSGGWTGVPGATQIDNTRYDNGSGVLATLPANSYGVHWLYMSTDGAVSAVYGSGSYSLNGAQNAAQPESLPVQLQGVSFIVGKIIVKNGAAAFTQTDSVAMMQRRFPGGSVPDHNSLLSLQGGTTDEYYHLTATEHDRWASGSASLAIMPNCTSGLTSKLLYDTTTGQFFCGVDQNTGGGGGGSGNIEFREFRVGGFDSFPATVSFDANNFNLTASGSDVTIALDWVNGPASRTAAQTISGAWHFTAASSQFSNTLEIGTASVSSATLKTLTVGNASASGTVEALALRAPTLGSDTTLTLAPLDARTFITGSASVSSNFEIGGYASASKIFGVGLSTCTSSERLHWNGATGRFECVDVSDLTGVPFAIREYGSPYLNAASASFSASGFNVTDGSNVANISLDYVNGPASRSIAQTITGAWLFTAASNQFSNTLEAKTASVSALTVNGQTIASYWTRSGSNLFLTNSGDNVGIGTSGPTSRLMVAGTASDYLTSAFNVLNLAGSSSFTVANSGQLAIGGPIDANATLRVQALRQSGAANVTTAGSSTTVTTTGNAFANIAADTAITANGETRYVIKKIDNNTVTVDTAVDWSGGYSFTYRNHTNIAVDGADADVRSFSIDQDGQMKWQLYSWHDIDSQFLSFWNEPAQKDILTLSERGQIGINYVNPYTGVIPVPPADLAIYPTAFDKVFYFVNSSSTYIDFTDNVKTSEDTPTPLTPATNVDFGYFGMNRKFSHAFVNILSGLTSGTLKMEYWNGGAWATVGPSMGFSDGTNGTTQSGVVDWDETLLTGWTPNTVNGQTFYWVRVSWTSVVGGPVRFSVITPDAGRRLAVFQAQTDQFPAFVVNGFGRVALGNEQRPSRASQPSGDGSVSPLSVIDSESSLRLWNYAVTGEPTIELISGTASLTDNLEWSMHMASVTDVTGAEGFWIERHIPGGLGETPVFTLGRTDENGVSRTSAVISNTFGNMTGGNMMKGLALQFTNGSNSGAGNQVRGLEVGGITPGTASESAIVVGSGWDYAFVASQGNVGIGTVTPNFRLEVGGAASISQFFGAGLQACPNTTILTWGPDGTFTCISVDTLTGVPFAIREIGSPWVNAASLSFSANGFNVTNVANDARISLDYINGPASRSLPNTWTALNTFSAGVSVSGTLEASTLKALLLTSDSGLVELRGIASVSGDFTTMGNVGIGTTNPTSRLTIVGTTSDSTANALAITNSNASPLLTVRNDGMGAIGTTPSLNATFAARSLTFTGAANVSTTGSSTTVTTTGGAFAGVVAGATLVANGQAVQVIVKVNDNTVITRAPVDWSGGYPFTYTNASFVAADGDANNSAGFRILRQGSPVWNFNSVGAESDRYLYLFNNDAKANILRITEMGTIGLNIPYSAGNTLIDPPANIAVYPQAFNAVIGSISGSFFDLTANAESSEDTPTPFTVTPNTDFVFLGMNRQFDSVFLERVTGPTSGVIKAEYWNGSGWVTIGGAMGFTDGTNGFTRSGAFSWTRDALTGWTTRSVNGSSSYYYVRISFTSYTGGLLRINMIVPGSQNRFDAFKAPLDADAAFAVSGLGRVSLGDSRTNGRVDDSSLADEGAALHIIDTNGNMRLWAFSASKTAELQLVSGLGSVSDNLHWDLRLASVSGPYGTQGITFRDYVVGGPRVDVLTLNNTNLAGTSAVGATLQDTFGAMNGSDLMRGLFLNYTNGVYSGAGNEVRGLDIGGIVPTTASESAIHVGSGWDYAFIASQGNVGIGTLTPNYRLEVGGAASISQYFGGGLTTCDADSFFTLQYDGTTGQFSCINSSGGARMEQNGVTVIAHVRSIDFAGTGFTSVASGTTEDIITLNWATGPASRTADQTITGHWNFAAPTSVSANLGVTGALTATDYFGGGLATCNGPTQKLTWSGGLFGCGVDQNTGGGGGGTGSIEVREFGAAYDSFPATISFDAGKFNLTASGGSDVKVSLDWGAGGPASLSMNENVTGQWTFSAAQVGLIVANNASVSGILEVTGAASSSALFGSGLSDCSGIFNVIRWTASTGKFSCGVEGGGVRTELGETTVVANNNALNFNASRFLLTASGSTETTFDLNLAGQWTFTGGVSISTNPFEVGSNVLYANPTTGRVGINTQNLSESLEVVGNASISGQLYAANIGIGTTNPQFLLDVHGDGQFGNGSDVNQVLLNFNVGHSVTMTYAKNQFGTAGNDGIQFRNGNVGQANMFTVYASSDAQFNAVSQAAGANSSLVAMNNPNIANLTNATEGLLTNKATTHDIAIQYSYGGGSPIDAILIDTNPALNAINAVIINNDNGAVPFRVAGQNDPNLLYVNGTNSVGIGTSAPLTKLEVQGTASASNLLTTGGLQVAGGTSVSYSRFGTNVTTHGLSTTSSLLISSRLEVDGDVFFDANASVSGNLEIGGFASASKTFGSGLSDCSDSVNSKLLWTAATGLFSCGNDQSSAGSGTFTGLLMAEGAATPAHITTLTFDAGAFNLSKTASSATLRLDYVNGPASRSIAQTITGAWSFTGGVSVSSPFEVVGNASISGNIYASNIGIGTTAPAAGFRLDTVGAARFGNGTHTTQTLLEFNVSHTLDIGYAVNQFGQSTFDGLQIRNINTEQNLFTVYGSQSTQIISNAQGGGFDSQLIAMNNSDMTSLTNATQGMLTNKATTHDIALQYRFGTGTPIDAILIDTNPTANSINSVIFNNANQNVSFRVAGQTDSNLLFAVASTSRVGIGTSAPLTKLEVQGTASASNLLTTGGLQVAGGTSVSYSRFGANVTTHGLNATDSLLISSRLEVDGQAFFDAAASISANLEVGGTASVSGGLFANGGLTVVGQLTAGNASLSGGLELTSAAALLGINAGGRTDATLEVGGTASISGSVRFGSNASVSANLEVGGTASISGKLNVSNSASISQNIEAAGYASASSYFGAGLTDCDSLDQRLTWTASGSNAGKFSCKSGSVSVTYTSGDANVPANGISAMFLFSATNTTAFSIVIAGNNEMKMSTAGYISACSVVSNANVTAGVMKVIGRKNGATMGTNANQYCTMNTTNPRTNSEAIPAGVLTFVAGDTIGVAASANATWAPTTSDIMISFTVTFPTGADLAETYYTNNEAVAPATVVTLDSGLFAGVTLASSAYDEKALGVISTAPGLVLGDGAGPGRKVYVALSGRVPVWVSDENGPIKPGDWLTTSSTPGVAMKATRAGRVIGQALTEHSGAGISQVVMFVKNTQYDGSQALQQMAAGSSDARTVLSMLAQPAASSSLSSGILTDRLVAGLDVIAPSMTTHQLSVDVFRSGSDSISFQELFQQHDELASLVAQMGEQASRSDQLQQFIVQTDTELTASDLALAQSVASQSARVDALALRLQQAEVSLAVLASDSHALTYNNVVLFSGGLRVDSIGSIGDLLTFGTDTYFFGRPYFNDDTAGFAVIRAGTREVRVPFTAPYLDAPIVNASLMTTASQSVDDLLTENVRFAIASVSGDGFTVRLSANAVADVRLSWIALAVHDARTVFSQIPVEPTPTPIPKPTSTDIPVTTVTPAPETPLVSVGATPEISASPEASASETPVPTPVLTPTPDATPTPTATPEVIQTMTPEPTPTPVILEPSPSELPVATAPAQVQ